MDDIHVQGLGLAKKTNLPGERVTFKKILAQREIYQADGKYTSPNKKYDKIVYSDK